MKKQIRSKNLEQHNGHEHLYRIFKDYSAKDCLTFYCTKCLKLKKIKYEYD